MKKKIFTLGSSTRTPQEFLDLLDSYQIEAIVDVRRFPTSRFDHFKKDNFKKLLEKKGILYFYLGKELGGYRKGGYEEYIKSDTFKEALLSLEKLACQSRIAIMCSERFAWRCHRLFIGLELEKRGWQVRHIIEKDRVWVRK